MTRSRRVLWGGFAAVALGLGGFAAWVLTLPEAAAARGAPPLADAEAAAIVDALKPPKRQRPVIAVLGINDATETTDYLMPAGILRRADVAEVTLLATGPGAVTLYPALTCGAGCDGRRVRRALSGRRELRGRAERGARQ